MANVMSNVMSVGTRTAVAHRQGFDDPKALMRFELAAEYLTGILGIGHGLDCIVAQQKSSMSTLAARTRRGDRTRVMARFTSSRLEVAEEHDFSTGTEPIGYLDHGRTGRFGSDGELDTETTAVVASLPRNPGGDVKVKGHPLSATDVAQCVELFQQPRSLAVNNVDGVRIALTHNIGGPTAVAAATILEGPGTNGS
jgi:acetyl-CoA C-acetyltransferase